MSDRVPCLVPFCRRTVAAEKLAAKGHTEWICAVHWKTVPLVFKRRKARFERLIRIGRKTDRVLYLLKTTWRRCRREAIERAGGIR